MRSQVKKFLLRGAAIALVVYAVLSLRIWLTAPTDGLNTIVEKENAKWSSDEEVPEFEEVQKPGRLEKPKDKLHGSSEETASEGKPSMATKAKKQPIKVAGSGGNASEPVVSAKGFVMEQYTDQLFTGQGPFKLAQSLFGNLTDGADGTKRYAIFPDEDTGSDRIVNQMRYIPLDVLQSRKQGTRKMKTIAVMPPNEEGNGRMKSDNCPVQECEFTSDFDRMKTADVVVWMQSAMLPSHVRPPNQVWVLFQLESPLNSQSYDMFRDQVNYSATYRHDSTIVTPYYKFVPFTNVTRRRQKVDHTAGKTKQVAWFVSNCGANNQRLQYARELGRYIGVDIFGACGDKQCPRAQANSCFQMLNKDYKFYLAFENSNCRDYITEKFYLNGLHQNVVPIVMGAHPDDYRRAAPEHSYIHVDEFESAKELAVHLHRLDRNDTLYNEYFEWKGTGEFVNTFWWCRLCAMAHAAESDKRSMQMDFEKWWRDGVCTEGSWLSHKDN